jgi:hypothetical protein
MAKSAMVMTPEDILAKYAEIQAKRRVSSLEWVEKNLDLVIKQDFVPTIR